MKPSYTIEKLSPYLNIENYLGENEAEDPYYFGYAFIQNKKIVNYTSSHTYLLSLLLFGTGTNYFTI
jgi:hypothetical protein